MRYVSISILSLLPIIAGCLPEECIIWSNDGTQALVLTDESYFLTDAQGHLTDVMGDPPTIAAWMPDSTGFIGQHMITVKTWDEALKLLPKGDTEAVIKRGDSILKQMKRFETNPKEFASPNIGPTMSECVALYLKDLHDAEVPDRFTTLRRWLKRSEFRIAAFALYQVKDKNVKLVRELCRSAVPASTMQISPTGEFFAFVRPYIKEPSINELSCAASTGGDATAISSNVAFYFTWRGNQSLTYVAGVGRGNIETCEVSEKQGSLTHDSKEDAQVEFASEMQVASLGDGRLVFSTTPISLPRTDSTDEKPRLFILEKGADGKSAIRPLLDAKAAESLPDYIHFFRVSPNKKRILVPGSSGRIVVIDVATGRVSQVRGEFKDTENGQGSRWARVQPVWRTDDSICYVLGDGVVLSTEQNGVWTPRRISDNWPDYVFEYFNAKRPSTQLASASTSREGAQLSP